jgi:hypothetical protein
MPMWGGSGLCGGVAAAVRLTNRCHRQDGILSMGSYVYLGVGRDRLVFLQLEPYRPSCPAKLGSGTSFVIDPLELVLRVWMGQNHTARVYYNLDGALGRAQLLVIELEETKQKSIGCLAVQTISIIQRSLRDCTGLTSCATTRLHVRSKRSVLAVSQAENVLPGP